MKLLTGIVVVTDYFPTVYQVLTDALQKVGHEMNRHCYRGSVYSLMRLMCFFAPDTKQGSGWMASLRSVALQEQISIVLSALTTAAVQVGDQEWRAPAGRKLCTSWA